jgi:septal ring factor EnvC (AmiA/AmiB activator)
MNSKEMKLKLDARTDELNCLRTEVRQLQYNIPRTERRLAQDRERLEKLPALIAATISCCKYLRGELEREEEQNSTVSKLKSLRAKVKILERQLHAGA